MEKDTHLPGQTAEDQAAAAGLASMPPLSLHPDETPQDAVPAPLPEARHIVALFGEGPLAREVAEQASRVGFAVDVLVERPTAHDASNDALNGALEDATGDALHDVLNHALDNARAEALADAQALPDARAIIPCESYAHAHEAYTVDARHYAVILASGLDTARELLMQLLPTSARYIGVIAGPEKKEKLFEELRRQGIPDAELACVRCPIGLAIGAETTEEISIAITAELIAARAGCLPRPRS